MSDGNKEYIILKKEILEILWYLNLKDNWEQFWKKYFISWIEICFERPLGKFFVRMFIP